MKKTDEKITALYCRSSTPNDGLIYKQKELLTDYVKNHNIEKYKFYIDNGFSGTNLARPDLKQLIVDVKKKLRLKKKPIQILTVPKIKFFLTALKNSNMEDIKDRKTLIAVFVNAIYLYDDKITFIFNSGDKPVTITNLLLSEIEKGHTQNEFRVCHELVGLQGLEPRTYRL